ncbi:MAG TPA: type II toxin-antitoxin system VapC family toxin, partial [Conexibacter sp.]|nr:type II toxin-antitoxin system VapC family toxin [Conexibacter sp.]
HVWLWWLAEPAKLSAAARQAIDEAQTVGVSAISAWEVGMLAARRRISLDRDVAVWVRQALAHARVREAPLTAEIALAAGRLDGRDFPGDPADRFVYATAEAARARLVTRDEAIRRFDPRTTVW